MQDLDQRLAADARLAPFKGRGGFLFGGLTAAVTLTFVGVILAVSFILTSRPGVLAMAIDFRVFWAAGQLALAGEPLAAHDLVRLGEVHASYPEAYMPWLYPPAYLVFVTPLGTMPFSVAFLVWTILSLVVTALAVRPFVAGATPLLVAMTLAPAYFPTLMLGQNSLYWMAGLLAALAALRAERWILAGVLIGLLTLKPQLGLMIPIALLAIGAWRTIFAATATTVALALVPTLFYGIGYWPLLKANLVEHGERIIYSAGNMKLMVSPMYTLTFFGVEPELALQAQWVIIAGAAVAVFALWRAAKVGFDAKVAGLLIAIMLSAPYLWYYEAALLAAVALFLLRAGILSLRPAHLPLLGVLWLGGSLQALNTFAGLVGQGWLGPAFIPPVLMICLGLCLRQVIAPRATDMKPA